MSNICNHGRLKDACETCAAWESACYNQKRAEKAEKEIEILKATIKRLKAKNIGDPIKNN